VLRELDSATRLSGGVPPTVAELSKSLDRSPATVFEHLIALVNRGLVRRTGSDRARNHVVAPAGRKFLDNTRISHHCPGVCSTETEDATTTNTGMTT